MPSLGPAEILVILVVALLVFGPNKMPEIARQVGKGFREFRRVQEHLKSELRDVVSEFDSPSVTDAPGPDPVPMLPPKEEPAPATVEVSVPSSAPETSPPETSPPETSPPDTAPPVAGTGDLAPNEAPAAPSPGPSMLPAVAPSPAPGPEPDAPRDSA